MARKIRNSKQACRICGQQITTSPLERTQHVLACKGRPPARLREPSEAEIDAYIARLAAADREAGIE